MTSLNTVIKDTEKNNKVSSVTESSNSTASTNLPGSDKIDLIRIIVSIYQDRWPILLLSWISVLIAILMTTLMQFKRPLYESSVSFISPKERSASTAGAMMGGQDGALGAMSTGFGGAGPADSASDSVVSLPILLNSKEFGKRIVLDLGLLPLLYKESYNPRQEDFKMDKPPMMDQFGNVMISAISLTGSLLKENPVQIISVKWNDPEIAAYIANNLFSVYENYLETNMLTVNQKTLRYLQKRIKEIEKDLQLAEEELRRFGHEHKVIKAAEQVNMAIQTIGKLQLSQFEAEIEKETLLQFQSRDSLQIRKLEIQSEALQRLTKRLIGEVLTAPTEENPANLMGGMDLPLGELRILAYQEIALEKNVETKRKIYEQLRGQFEQTQIQVKKESSLVKVIDAAIPNLNVVNVTTYSSKDIVGFVGAIAPLFATFLVMTFRYFKLIKLEYQQE